METTKLRGYHDFIIKSDFEYADTFKTESGLELHLDARFSADKLANRVVTVLQVPVKLPDCEIRPGYQVMIDPSIYYRQNYDGFGDVENNFMLDRQKGIFKISPAMIVLYRETPESEWKGFNDSLMVAYDKVVVPEKKLGELIIEKAKEQKSDSVAQVIYANTSEDITAGDKIYTQGGIAVPFWIDGKEYHWINNYHVLAKLN